MSDKSRPSPVLLEYQHQKMAQQVLSFFVESWDKNPQATSKDILTDVMKRVVDLVEAQKGQFIDDEFLTMRLNGLISAISDPKDLTSTSIAQIILTVVEFLLIVDKDSNR